MLQEAEEEAKSAGVGRWSNQEPAKKRTEILHELSKSLAEKLVNQPLTGIVEHVKDGSSFKIGVFLPLNKPKEERTIYQIISLNLSGIKCPTLSEEHGEEAKFYTESRLLNREVDVYVEQASTMNFVSVIGSILLGDKNIACFLLQEGLAKTVDRTIGLVQGGIEKYREAERFAKLSKSRVWKNYEVVVQAHDSKKQFNAKVIEIGNAESITVVKNNSNEVVKIWFSSIRGPKGDNKNNSTANKVRPLYDVPLMFESREFLRKKLIGKDVTVKIDYEQPKTEQFPAKTFATVFLQDVNIAVALVLKGYATVVKRNDGEQKSCAFDDLLEAESKALKANKGLFCKTLKFKPMKPVDASSDVNRAAFQLDSLSGGAPKDAIVEYVFSSTKFKCYLPKENILLNFVLGGILVEKTGKADENTNVVKNLVQHRNVKLSFERVDKAGNFIGSLKFELESNALVSLAYYLIKEGYCKIRDEKDSSLVQAQSFAQSNRKGIWANYVEEEPVVEEEENGKENESDNILDDDKKDSVDVLDVKNLEKGVVSLVLDDGLSLYIQKVEYGNALEQLIMDLRKTLTENPPLAGAYRPKVGDYCASIFREDGLWYRAKVLKVNLIEKTVEISYIDYGNKAVVRMTDEVCPLPGAKFGINVLPPVAQLYGLSYVYLPKDEDAIEDARAELEARLCNGKEFYVKTEYVATDGQKLVTLIDVETKEDIVLKLVKEGFYCVNKRNYNTKKKTNVKQYNIYKEAMEKALEEHLNLWRYGDIREDVAKEFGI
ncbi:hypothetical protein RND71_043908 [Anisodus tanguticus]|uniref:Staphylococcal nuclease domain-containing protein n=1 Tax=Anisodus tanguticus TaxID=243964 RepID=A0AAE1QQL0_9SOLA|nr:hypothetical protein RND71_043908 [Anisodus tanguticus]